LDSTPSPPAPKWAKLSAPIDSTRSIFALKTRPRERSFTSDASSNDSGRMPATRFLPEASPTPSGSGTSPIGSFTVWPSIVAGRKFIAGDPMNPATKMLAGLS
jgi:hypothetical protein